MSFVPYRCIVQHGRICSRTEQSLRTRLSEHAEGAFGAPAVFNWLVVPVNSGFTAGSPSTCSFVLVLANRLLDSRRRTGLLREICDVWMQETGCGSEEVVVAIGDPR